MRLDGFGIMVNDMKTMVEFYRDVLGFEIQWDGKDPSVYLVKDGTAFMFYGRNDLEHMLHRRLSYAEGVNGHYEVALSVENYAAVDEAFKRVVALGAEAILPPENESWGQRTCYVADPEGNLIEIGSFNK